MVTETLSNKNVSMKLSHTGKTSWIILKNLIHEKPDTWKIQLKISLDFISSKDTDEEHVLHSNSDNIGIIIYNKPNKAIKEVFKS